MKIQAVRYHDFSAGHRVVGHEGKCSGLHGHNYRVHFYCEAPLVDDVGRVIDFSVIKSTLCQWLEDNWDHMMLLWLDDPVLEALRVTPRTNDHIDAALDAIVSVPFNPTAENMAGYLLLVIGPKLLAGTGVRLARVVVEETRKCSAEVSL